MLTSKDIRKKFIDYFKAEKHNIQPSIPLIPPDDPTMLFTTAGMVPFKDMFSGKVKLEYVRAVSIQKCFRTTDIDNIGLTSRHLTFFEMLGNFSFGDYFKEDAIKFAWEFLIKELNIPKEKLYITIYKDDDEAFNIWKDIVGEGRITRLGEDSNFWIAGETGPCGPCSEILYDLGEELSCGPQCKPGCDCDRFLEIWNLVFTQFEKDENGKMLHLKQKNIDTGMGLERLTEVVQDVKSPYETDLFKPIWDLLYKIVSDNNKNFKENKKAFRVICDHSRSAVFLITDGITPTNDGRGYVLKRIIRRAVRFGHILGLDNFLGSIALKVIDNYSDIYPEILKKKKYIIEVINNEEAKFNETLLTGMKVLEELKAKYKKENKIPGIEIFKLYDTYGFPHDFAFESLKDDGFLIDKESFDQALESHKDIARSTWKEEKSKQDFLKLSIKYGKSLFVGYEKDSIYSKVKCIVKENDRSEFDETEKASEGENIGVVIEETPFYSESGGQMGDLGDIFIKKDEEIIAQIIIENTIKIEEGFIVHFGKIIKGSIKKGDKVYAQVNKEYRNDIRRNHTATHILQAVLRDVLGHHITQSGSVVTNDRFRFDFTHPKMLTQVELELIEKKINNIIWNNYTVTTKEMGIEEARSTGALAFFGEKYGQTVRIVRIESEALDNEDMPVSTEFCGGIHCNYTGQIGFLKIVSESSIASGIRRIEAVTGRGALEFIDARLAQLENVASTLKVSPMELENTVLTMLKNNKERDKKVKELKKDMFMSNIDSIINDAQDLKGMKTLIKLIPDIDKKELREKADLLRDKIKSGLVILLTRQVGIFNLAITITKDLTKNNQIHAGNLVKEITLKFGGGGGGRPDSAQAGFKSETPENKIIEDIKEIIKK